jgi:UDP-N-acetylglucosamine diphosphorylase/glucosamine-1-phosphate N-acetyltransferase
MENSNLILFDLPETWKSLLPLTFTRSVADIRIGILTIREKWEQHFKQKTSCLVTTYLSDKYPLLQGKSNLYINGAVLPTTVLTDLLQQLPDNKLLVSGSTIIGFKSPDSDITFDNIKEKTGQLAKVEFGGELFAISQPWDIFKLNGVALEQDFDLLTFGRESQHLSKTNILIGPVSNLFIEKGAIVEASVLNTNTGPIYIGKDAEIMENCAIRGPFALCEHAGLKMSTKIYGATTIGPFCKAGGEINNSVMFAYSNKGHDGFLGNSVLGEWCNLGADTNNSNLKNNYGEVDLWSYAAEKSTGTGLQFCGLIMGDHSKSGINTMFNTGTVVGVSANIFGADFPPKFIPSFSWGGAAWLRTFTFDKGLEVASRMMERRGLTLSEAEISILKHIYDHDSKFRK